MKRWNDMDQREQDDFVLLTLHITARLSGPRPVGITDLHMTIATILMVKTYGRSLVNARTEFEVDPESFVRDAVEVGRRFFENTRDMGNEPDDEISNKANFIVRMMGDSRFAPAAERYFGIALRTLE